MPAPATEQPSPSGRGRPRVQVHPGTGLVDRRGDTLLVVPVLPASAHQCVRRLLELTRQDGTGPSGTDALLALLDQYSSAELPGFALLVGTGGSLRLLVHGQMRIVVDERAWGQSGSGGDDRFVEHVLEDGAWHDVTIAADEGTPDGGPQLPGFADVLELDLVSGTVPGGGVTVLRTPAGLPQPSLPAGAAVSVPMDGSTSSTALRPTVQFRTVLLGECALKAAAGQPAPGPARPPLPVAGAPEEGTAGTAGTTGRDVLVEGVLCPAGHFTDPDRSTCRTCGTPLAPDERRVTAPRPPLGILVTDGGTIYTVTGNVVIGREAESAPDVIAGQARPLPLRDAARSTSRVHARLTVQAWQVLLSDNSSANGTFVSRNGAAGPWLPVPPHTPLALVHGDRVRLGRRQLLFDTWRETAVPEVFR